MIGEFLKLGLLLQIRGSENGAEFPEIMRQL